MNSVESRKSRLDFDMSKWKKKSPYDIELLIAFINTFGDFENDLTHLINSFIRMDHNLWS